jgi:hypothetical protein
MTINFGNLPQLRSWHICMWDSGYKQIHAVLFPYALCLIHWKSPWCSITLQLGQTRVEGKHELSSNRPYRPAKSIRSSMYLFIPLTSKLPKVHSSESIIKTMTSKIEIGSFPSTFRMLLTDASRPPPLRPFVAAGVATRCRPAKSPRARSTGGPKISPWNFYRWIGCIYIYISILV